MAPPSTNTVNDSTATPRTARASVVVWHPRGHALRSELTDALAQRQCEVIRCDNEFAAMAALCKVARRSNREPAVLILVEPMQLSEPGLFVVLQNRYAPSVALWQFESDHKRVRAVLATDIARWTAHIAERDAAKSEWTKMAAAPAAGIATPAAAQSAPVGTPGTPTLRLAGVDAAASQVEAKPGQAQQSAPAVSQAPQPRRVPTPRSAAEAPAPAPRAGPGLSLAWGEWAGHVVPGGNVESDGDPLSSAGPIGNGRGTAPAGPTGSELSDEELAMLLAPDDDRPRL